VVARPRSYAPSELAQAPWNPPRAPPSLPFAGRGKKGAAGYMKLQHRRVGEAKRSPPPPYPPPYAGKGREGAGSAEPAIRAGPPCRLVATPEFA